VQVSGQIYARGKKPRYPLEGGLVGPRSGLDAVTKRSSTSLSLPGTKLPFSPYLSHYSELPHLPLMNRPYRFYLSGGIYKQIKQYPVP